MTAVGLKSGVDVSAIHCKTERTLTTGATGVPALSRRIHGDISRPSSKLIDKLLVSILYSYFHRPPVNEARLRDRPKQ